MRLLPLLLLLACPSDDGLVRRNEAPEVRFTTPTAGSTLSPHQPVRISAEITDDASTLEEMTIVAVSDVEGALEGAISASDTIWQLTLSAPLRAGPHTLTVRAIDHEGVAAEASVAVVMGENQAPTVTLTQPSASTVQLSGDPVSVRARVTDDGPLADLSLQWADAAAGLGPTTVGEDGVVSFALPNVAPGPLPIRVVVADAWGAFAEARVTVNVLNADQDGDGHRPLALGGDDCDDTDALVHPGASERCNGEDDDCDGDVDEGVTDPETWHRDADGDGRGRADDTVEACEEPAGYAFLAGDCDDTDAAIRPGAPERCNGQDDDCDGVVPPNETTDADNDGHRLCADCNDADAQVHPGAAERCNGVDDNCDGVIPPNERSDADGDGFVTCADCLDTDPAVRPGASERCNGRDDDCDGVIPANETTDADGDGHVACADCADNDASRSPTALEACNLRDDDCDGSTDEAACGSCAMQSYAASGGPASVYQFCPTPMTWHAARSQCLSWGYRMIAIQNPAEDAWAHSIVDPTYPERWWLGAADELVEGSFGWENGQAWSYTNWAPGEPNNIDDEDCVELNGHQDGRWNDVKCSLTRRFICEGQP